MPSERADRRAPSRRSRPLAADGAQREGDVLVDGEMRIERVVLEDEGDVAIGGAQVLDRLAVEQDVARVDLLEAGDGAQRRGLAAARGAEEDDEFLVLDRQVDVADDVDGAEMLVDVAQFDLSHGCPPRDRVETETGPVSSSSTVGCSGGGIWTATLKPMRPISMISTEYWCRTSTQGWQRKMMPRIISHIEPGSRNFWLKTRMFICGSLRSSCRAAGGCGAGR